jgi:hypothetical protein
VQRIAAFGGSVAHPAAVRGRGGLRRRHRSAIHGLAVGGPTYTDRRVRYTTLGGTMTLIGISKIDSTFFG